MPAWAAAKTIRIPAGLGAAGILGAIPPMASTILAASPPKPTASEEVRAAIAQMGMTLHVAQFSFHLRTLCVYVEPTGQPLQIAHVIKIVGLAVGPSGYQCDWRRRVDQAVL